MKKLNILYTILLLSGLVLSSQSAAQDINISGLVVNSNQQPVANVKVSLSGLTEIICYSDHNGEFTLTNASTSVTPLDEERSTINLMPNGGLEFTAFKQPFRMTIFDMLGRTTGSTVFEENLHGTYTIFPDAYIQNMPVGIYFVSVTLGSQLKGFKIHNLSQNFHVQELIQTGYAINEDKLANKYKVGFKDNKTAKKNLNGEDTLIFEHDFYKITRHTISNYDQNVGTIELENFSNYSPAANIEPDKIVYNRQYGNFLKVNGLDSTQFIICIEPYSILEKELAIKAIPVQEFEFLDSSFKFISGIHLEPSGTHFYFPLHVNIELNNAVNTDSLVVILHNDETGKISYLPFNLDEEISYLPLNLDEEDLKATNVGFFISHFSDLIIAEGEIPENVMEVFTDSDDAISYIKYLLTVGEEVPDIIFEKWYNEVIKYEIMSIVDMETLKFAVHDLMLLGQYANYANKFFDQLSFYDEAINGLNDKIQYQFNLLVQECNNLSDKCLKKELILIAVQLNMIAQQIDGINDLPLSELCNGTALEIVDKIEINKMLYPIEEGSSAQILYAAKNINNETIDAELEWYSDDPEIVRVDSNGYITAISKGNTRIHARICDVESLVQVNVTDNLNHCTSLPRPVENGTYNTRILLTGKYVDTWGPSITQIWDNINITLVFDSNTYAIYWGKIYVTGQYQSYRLWEEYSPSEGYIMKERFYSDYYDHTKKDYLTCTESGCYSWTARYGVYFQIAVYVNSRTFVVKKFYGELDGKTLIGTGTF